MNQILAWAVWLVLWFICGIGLGVLFLLPVGYVALVVLFLKE